MSTGPMSTDAVTRRPSTTRMDGGGVKATSAQPAAVDLATYRSLQPPWNDWDHVKARGRAWARVLADLLLGGGEGGE